MGAFFSVLFVSFACCHIFSIYLHVTFAIVRFNINRIISQNYSFTKIYGAQSIVSANPTLSPTAMQKFSAVIAETQQQQQLDHLGFPLTTHKDDSEASYVDQLAEIDAAPGMVRKICCFSNYSCMRNWGFKSN